MRRVLRVLPWFLVLASVVVAIITWDALPDQISMKIDFQGNPTRLRDKVFWSWFGLPLLALGTVGLLSGLRALMPRYPELFNHSEKERFLRLPNAYRAPVFDALGAILDVTSLWVGLTVLEVQILLFRAGMGHRITWAMPVVLITGLAITPIVLLMLSRVTSAVELAERDWAAAGRPRD
jgi:uncharacterized membrane protein